jgi:hypothetical protein
MEHFEIAEMFGRRRKPALSLFWRRPSTSPTSFGFVRVVIGLYNAGRGAAKHPAVRLIGSHPHIYGLDGNGNTGLPEKPISHGRLFAGGADHIVYPGTHLEITALSHEIPTVSPSSGPWLDLAFEYELFAEEMLPAKGQFRVSGDKLRAAYGSVDTAIHYCGN